MTILLYQLAIVATLILTRLIAPNRLLTAAFIWTALTAINVFWPPLLVGQLVVVWVTYSLLQSPNGLNTPSDLSKKAGSAQDTSSRSSEIPSSVRETSHPLLRADEKNNRASSSRVDHATPRVSSSARDQEKYKQQPTSRLEVGAESHSTTFLNANLQTPSVNQVEASALSSAETPSIRRVRSLPSLSETTKLDIRNAVIHQQLPSLIHFTRASNLNSILTHGLCSVTEAHERGIKPNINDQMRLDRLPQAISLSIGFPNHRMFYKYRQLAPNEQWVILVIDPSVLWKQPSAFCQRNAADHRIRERPLNELMTADAFRSMFVEIPGGPSRKEQRLRDDDPTDAQAEALVFETIEPGKIGGVAFDSAQTKKLHEHMLGNRAWQVYKPNSGLFGIRSLARS